MKIYLFVGPTISQTEARSYLEAIYLPPVSQGDIVSLLPHQPQVIGIIDGYFENVPAVWHKEILLALSQGVRVVGAASMGALRAAELHSFGMVGIGRIFEWYRDGLLEADDEVAVRHAPATHDYRAVGEALVNIRRTLQVAQEAGVISPTTGANLLALAQQTHYLDRAYPHLYHQARQLGLPTDEINHFQQFPKINQKKLDAQTMLRYLAELQPDRQPVDFTLNYTSKLTTLIDKDVCLRQDGQVRLTREMLIHHVRLASNDFAGLKQRTLAQQARLTNQAIINQLHHENLYEPMIAETIAKEQYCLAHPPPEVDEARLYHLVGQIKSLNDQQSWETYLTELGFTNRQLWLWEILKYLHWQGVLYV